MQVKLHRQMNRMLKTKSPAFAGLFLWPRENKIGLSGELSSSRSGDPAFTINVKRWIPAARG